MSISIYKYVNASSLFTGAALDNATNRMLDDYNAGTFFRFCWVHIERSKKGWSPDHWDIFEPFEDRESVFLWTDELMIENLVTDKELEQKLQWLIDNGGFDRIVSSEDDYAELLVRVKH